MRYYKLTLYKIVENRQNHIEINEADERRRYVRSSCPSITTYDLEKSDNKSSNQDNSNEFSIYGADLYKKKDEQNDESNEFHKLASRFIVKASQYLIITGVAAVTMNPFFIITTTLTLLALEDIVTNQLGSFLKSGDKVEFEVMDDDKEEEGYQGLDSEVNSQVKSQVNSDIVNQIIQKANLATDNSSGYHAFEAHRINQGNEVSYEIEDKDIKELV